MDIRHEVRLGLRRDKFLKSYHLFYCLLTPGQPSLFIGSLLVTVPFLEASWKHGWVALNVLLQVSPKGGCILNELIIGLVKKIK